MVYFLETVAMAEYTGWTQNHWCWGNPELFTTMSRKRNTFDERILCWCVIRCPHLTNRSAFSSKSLRSERPSIRRSVCLSFSHFCEHHMYPAFPKRTPAPPTVPNTPCATHPAESASPSLNAKSFSISQLNDRSTSTTSTLLSAHFANASVDICPTPGCGQKHIVPLCPSTTAAS